jgi:hypothetical protein
LNRLWGFELLLAATRHIVVLPGSVFVLAFATIELVRMDVLAIPTVDDVRALASRNIIIAVAPLDDVSVIFVNLVALQGVVARPAVDDVVAVSSPDVLVTAKAAYLVIAVKTVLLVGFVGAQEQAALGAAR